MRATGHCPYWETDGSWAIQTIPRVLRNAWFVAVSITALPSWPRWMRLTPLHIIYSRLVLIQLKYLVSANSIGYSLIQFGFKELKIQYRTSDNASWSPHDLECGLPYDKTNQGTSRVICLKVADRNATMFSVWFVSGPTRRHSAARTRSRCFQRMHAASYSGRLAPSARGQHCSADHVLMWRHVANVQFLNS